MTNRKLAIPLTLAGLLVLVGFVISPLLFLLLAVPLSIVVGIPTIVILLARRPRA